MPRQKLISSLRLSPGPHNLGNKKTPGFKPGVFYLFLKLIIHLQRSAKAFARAGISFRADINA